MKRQGSVSTHVLVRTLYHLLVHAPHYGGKLVTHSLVDSLICSRTRSLAQSISHWHLACSFARSFARLLTRSLASALARSLVRSLTRWWESMNARTNLMCQLSHDHPTVRRGGSFLVSCSFDWKPKGAERSCKEPKEFENERQREFFAIIFAPPLFLSLKGLAARIGTRFECAA